MVTQSIAKKQLVVRVLFRDCRSSKGLRVASVTAQRRAFLIAEKGEPMSSKEQVDKWLKSIENAGTSANAFGWVLYPLSPFILFLYGGSQDATVIALWALLLAPLFVIYILSGKYIKTMRGPHVPKLLLFNAITSLLLIRGIIPLILSIQSFIAYSNFKKVSKMDIVVKVDEDKAKIKPYEIGLMVTFYILGLIILIGMPTYTLGK